MIIMSRTVKITYHPNGTYRLDFDDPINTSDEGFLAESGCLCWLDAAAETWLKGGTNEDVMGVISSSCNRDHR